MKNQNRTVERKDYCFFTESELDLPNPYIYCIDTESLMINGVTKLVLMKYSFSRNCNMNMSKN